MLLPHSYAEIALNSRNQTVFAPATLLRLLFPDSDGLGEEIAGRVPRFLDYDCDIWEPCNGIKLRVEAGVFVPDPMVVDLVGSALLDPGSPLRDELLGSEVLEPCTGTGILAITLMRAGAAVVRASDIDPASCRSARYNARRSGLEGRLHVALRSGLTESDSPADMVFVNPPWYSSEEMLSFRMGPAARRCYVDRDYALLKRLLRSAHALTSPDASFYLIAGENDPLDPHRNTLARKILVNDLGWFHAEHWDGARQTRLYRLKKLE